MAVDLITREQISESGKIPVSLGEEIIGFISVETWRDMDSPEYKRATFDIPESIEEESEES